MYYGRQGSGLSLKAMTNTPKEQALEEDLSAALATVAMLKEDGERLDWIQSVLSGLDADCAPDALCANASA